jgi:PAS domain S-box-containing protein
LVDINGNIIHANETFNKTFGLDSQEIKGKSFEAHVQPECQDELYLYLKRTDKGTLQSGIEIKLNFYGHIFIVHLTAAKEKEDVYRIALIDLTDNVMMKNKIEDDEKQLEYKDITRNKIVEVLPDILYFYEPRDKESGEYKQAGGINIGL